jgi:tRNA threonylcarbamoyladenosine biosynthesis protein TsaB
MPLLLAIETATDVCSVALLAEGNVVGTAEVLRPRAHAASLAPLVRDVLAREGASAADLAAVAVSAGPGSFTGLRIGVSTAKGLAFAGGAALVGVPSLEALAAGAAEALGPGDLLLTAFRSRRGEVYAAAFTPEGDGGLREAAPASGLRMEELAAWLPEAEGTLWVAGEASDLALEALGRPARALRGLRPRAEFVGRLGWARYQGGHTEDVAAFEPAYLKAFEARRGGSIFDRLLC